MVISTVHPPVSTVSLQLTFVQEKCILIAKNAVIGFMGMLPLPTDQILPRKIQ
jgi:hypothetical protein